MGKFDNAFAGVGGKGGGSGVEPGAETRPKIDYAAQNKALVELFGTADKARSRVGIISGIINLGVQKIEDAKLLWTGTPEQEAEEIAKNPKTYFENGVNPQNGAPARFKRWPKKSQQSVAITVDYPQYKFDWGGEVGEKPIRFLLNGEFTPKGKKPWDAIVGRTYDLKETTQAFDPKWSLDTKGVLYKLAVATEVIKAGEPFSKNDIGKLIGKPALFEVRLWLENGFLQEKITFKGEVPEGVPVPEWDDSLEYFVRLDIENDESAVKQLRKAVKNTIKMSSEYVGSKLHEQFDSVMFPSYGTKAETKEAGVVEGKVAQAAKPVPVKPNIPQMDDEDLAFDDSDPFANPL